MYLNTILKILIVLGILTFKNTLFAQDNGTQWGKQAEQAKAIHQLYMEYGEFTKNYEQAYPRWYWLFMKAPRCDERIYKLGPTIVKHEIAIEKEGYRRQVLEDTLFMVYDQWIKYFKQEGKILGLKAIEMFDRRLDSRYYDELLKTVNRSVELQKVMTTQDVLPVYYKMNIIMYNKGSLPKEKLLSAFSMANEVVAYKHTNPSLYRGLYQKCREEMYQLIEKHGIVSSCEDVEAIFNSSFNKYPGDTILVDLYHQYINQRECEWNKNFVAVAIKKFNNNPESSLAADIANYFVADQKYDSAVFYLKLAIQYEEDNKIKSDYAYKIADVYFTGLKDVTNARFFAMQSDSLDHSSGKPIMLMGDLFLYDINSCTNGDTIHNKMIYLLVAEKYNEAKRRNADLAEDIQTKLATIESQLPTDSNIINAGYSIGEIYKIDCWNTEVKLIGK